MRSWFLPETLARTMTERLGVNGMADWVAEQLYWFERFTPSALVVRVVEHDRHGVTYLQGPGG